MTEVEQGENPFPPVILNIDIEDYPHEYNDEIIEDHKNMCIEEKPSNSKYETHKKDNIMTINKIKHIYSKIMDFDKINLIDDLRKIIIEYIL